MFAMDPKVLCPTLSVMLVKTIKALCEINIKYDQKLEITGSLHVRSDGEKVLTCLLDETTIKGQQDAAKAADIAARLALPNIGFPFPTLQLPTNVSSQPQQLPAFLSPIQAAGVPPPGMPPPPPPPQVMSNESREKHITSPNQTSSGSSSSSHDLHHAPNPLALGGHSERSGSKSSSQENHRGGGGGGLSSGMLPSLGLAGQLPVGHLPMVAPPPPPPPPPHTSSSSSHHHHHHHHHHSKLGQPEPMDTEAVVQAELQQAMVSLRRQSSGSGSTSGSSSEAVTPRANRTSTPSVAKLLETAASQGSHYPPSSAAAVAATAAAAVAAVAQNHVRLPNIQTLTQCLPKYPIKNELGEKAGCPLATPGGNSTPQAASVAIKGEVGVSGGSSGGGAGSGSVGGSSSSQVAPNPSGATTPTSTSSSSSSTMPSMAFPVDPLASVKVEVQQQLDSDGNLVHKKKFQCMFCGIFLSTKCYLKNHINAMHTRARVYPCELCERYFYSAGALRIHKLRNHWQGSKKHKCVHCGETFLLPIELRKHILKKHLGSPEALLMEGANPPHLGFMMKAGTEGGVPPGPSHLLPGVTMVTTAAEAAMAAASLAAAAGMGEPLSLVTSPVQAMPQNLSRTPVSSDSPASVSASLDDGHTSLSHQQQQAEAAASQAGSQAPEAMVLDTHPSHLMLAAATHHNELGNGRGGGGHRHQHAVITPISPPSDALPPE